MSRVEPAPNAPALEPGDADATASERSRLARLYYITMRWICCFWFLVIGGIRASGREHVPATGAALLVSNHVSFYDVLVLGIPMNRYINYVARSTLFVPVFGFLLRKLGGYAIQREGMGASGLKETLRRLRRGGIVVLFPEGTRSRDGRVAELKAGIAVIAQKARVPVVPAAVAGTFEAWPRTRLLPGLHASHVQYGPAILPDEIAGLPPDTAAALIRDRIAACYREAQRSLARELQIEPAGD